MAWWTEQVLPRLIDRLLGISPVGRLRARVCAGLAGEVVELGFGSGLNVTHYPPAVRRVAAVEPSDVAWDLALPRIRSAAAKVWRAGLDGQRLDLPDDCCDAALSTFTLCTIPDVDAALAEVRRVLRPQGSLHFLEHGLAPGPVVARLQHLLQPVQQRVAGGCHLDRPIREHLERSGLRVDELDACYVMGKHPLGYLYLGRATNT